MEVPVLLVEFEGVVADTAAVRRAALIDALAVEGIVPDDAALAAAAGHPTDEAVRRARRAAGASEDETAVELARLRAERSFASRAGKGLSLQPEVRATLERLATSCRLALVTRASRREVVFVLDLAGLVGIFRPIVAHGDTATSKPSRAPYAAALERIGQLFPGQQLRPLAVEDHLVGIRGARAAGIRSVAVGAMPAHEVLEADGWVESIGDLDTERIRSLLVAAAGGER
jgi:HAD superfamily hydrolase (TIGR01509 family)